MCGLFGLVTGPEALYSDSFIEHALRVIAEISEIRGKDSSGIAFLQPKEDKIRILKGDVPISYFVTQKEFSRQIRNTLRELDGVGDSSSSFAAIGHARLVTNGSQLRDENNQPVVKDGVVAIHNGIIVNVDDLWRKYPHLKKAYDIDTEILLSMIRRNLDQGWDTKTAVSIAIRESVGTISAGILFNDRDLLMLATNNGSLYFLTNERDFFMFASERYFLKKVSAKLRLDKSIGKYSIKPIFPGEGYRLDLKTLNLERFLLDSAPVVSDGIEKREYPYLLEESHIGGNYVKKEVVIDINDIRLSANASRESRMLEYNIDKINRLRRCQKCLLPESFPFIDFDKNGVCNYCRSNVPRNQPKRIEELFKLVEPYRRGNGELDCIVPFSGGRDSTFTLHIIKNVLKLNPIALTYDWGMVTDLARRNIARVCGKLGVENIIVSANISWKRENIKKNISAWLQKPHLGMVPLFMAGDKYFFYYTDQLKKQTGIKLNIWGVNPLENTEFKVGFCGIHPNFEKKRIYSLKWASQLRLFGFIGRNLVQNPHYLNRSVLDTMGSFVVRYIVPRRDYYHLFDYYKWDEKEIERVLQNVYDWERAIDTKTTWRIGDGTAAFYNYIYYTVAGFSEYETFRSNQIREGTIDRNKALRLAEVENRPRYESIKWYLEIIGLDYESTITKINNIPKLY